MPDKQKNIVTLFYGAIVFVAVAAVIHLIIDPPVSWPDIISNALFTGSVVVLIGITFLLLRPQLQGASSTLAMMKLLKGVASAANEAETIEEGLQSALDAICDYTGWSVGHVYLYSEESKTLASTGLWHVKDPLACARFKHVSEAMIIHPGEGFIGEVYSDATPMWILNVADSGIYLRKEAAQAAGLKAAFAFPIFMGRKVAAIMEFYDANAHIPSETLLSVMANVGKQLGQTIERTRFREHAMLLETVISSANDGIIITKADLQHPGPEIMYVNEAFTHISGYSAAEAIGKSPRFLQGDQTNTDTLQLLRSSLAEGRPFKGELLNYHKNGTPYWLDISIVPIRNANGDITHFAAIERDITEAKKADRQLKETFIQMQRANLKAEAAARDLEVSLRKAEEANKAKSDFLANMSHELRTPMNGVLGMAHLLADTHLDVDQQECVSTINASAENLLMLLNDILDFSKIEAGALELENIPFALVENIRTTINLLRPNAQRKNLELIVDCDDDLPGHVMGDPGRLRQIITNLIGNAVKFTDAGYVRVAAKILEQNGQPLLHVRVEDTGIGIPADKITTIFEKFTQGDASVTRKYGGTGLGLAISQQLVSLMGGTMGVESAEGKGSTFWFSIPCASAQYCDISQQMEHLQPRLHQNIARKPIGEVHALLVEDYPVNQVFALKLLKKFGFTHIDLAENGVEALLKYRTHVYDVIFMDCQMPDLDGYQTTEKIRLLESDTPLHTPIIAMTANAMMGDREKCLKAGMDDYISKPLRAAHLKTILQSLFILGDDNTGVAIGKKVDMPKPDAEDPPMDMEQLRLFTDGDPEEEKALVALFMEQAEEMLTLLQNNMDIAASAVWKSAAHRFKGASGNFGAMKLHHLCKRAEMHCDDTPPQKQEMLAALQQEAKRVERFFCHSHALSA